MKIRIGIVGFGNLGKGAALAVDNNPDMELRAVFTRRDPETINIGNCSLSHSGGGVGRRAVPCLNVSSAETMVNDIDVMLLCGGSASDLPEQGPYFASLFNTVDSYDNHSKIPEYMASIDAVAQKTTSIISTGWDPGLFSIMRVLFESSLPGGMSYTFWGKGFSQGHSDAVRRINGVKYAAQYTIPVESAIEAVRCGKNPEFTAKDKHLRECFVVAESDSDRTEIEKEIKSMPNYFADFDTKVNFIEADEFMANHSEMPHGGMVLRSGKTGKSAQTMEFSLKLDSNPEFTGSILAMYARAAFRMSQEGLFGAKTVFDVPLSYLAEKNRSTLVKDSL